MRNNKLLFQRSCIILLLLLFQHSIAIEPINVETVTSDAKFEKPLVELPADFPPITITTSNNPSSGKVFLANYGNGYGFYLIILDSNGSIYKYHKLPMSALDFKMQPNGLLSYPSIIKGNPLYGSAEVEWMVTDTNFIVVDSFMCGNGYMADLHEFQLLPNGNSLLMSYYSVPYDMSQIIPKGIPNARITHSLIQEIDPDKNVIFQWRSEDYIPLEDAYVDLSSVVIAPSHINALELDYDGNILVSSRQLSEITKVNRMTGEIMWRLGGKQNQFQFINENEANAPNYFSMMHSIRRLPNGHIILLDNGNQHQPSYSRGVEYELDEVNKIAKLVWEWRHTPDIFSASMGSIQRLDSGETLIGWGGPLKEGEPSISEINKDGEVTFELSLPSRITSYRAYKFNLDKCKLIASVAQRELFDGDEKSFNDKNNITNTRVAIETIRSMWVYNRIIVERYDCPPINPRFKNKAPIVFPYRWIIIPSDILQFKGDFYFNLDHINGKWDYSKAKIYYRDTAGSGEFTLLPTIYDTEKNELKATITKFGEFIIGIPEDVPLPQVPLLILPIDKEKMNNTVPIRLIWSPRGYYNSSHLLISDDIDFNNIIIDTITKTSNYNFNNFISFKTYFWKVRLQNEVGFGDWSEIRTLIPVDPFIQITYPNGGEVFYKDSTYIIRWQKNILADQYVKIQLIRGTEIIDTIRDSLLSQTGAVKWKVSNAYETDSNYRVIITNLNNEELKSQCESQFTIRDAITSVENELIHNKIIEGFTCYPNPARNVVNIEFTLNCNKNVSLIVYDLSGKLISEIESAYLNEGHFIYSWQCGEIAAGRYICKLKVGDSIIPYNINIEK